jgi:glycogen phosphorylase
LSAGHDQFPMELAERVIGMRRFDVDWRAVVCSEGRFNLTHMALTLSHYINGVAKRHGEVSRLMFAHYTIDAITNGVHAATWAAPAFQALFDRHVPDWRTDNLSLRYALGIPRGEVWHAHCRAKDELIQHVNDRTDRKIDPAVLTLGFARRATAYKRADLIFQDPERLRRIAAEVGPIQVVFAGKAHPDDAEGKGLIKRIFAAREALRDAVRVAYLEDYDVRLARLLTAGVDVWLNTPLPPMEASGTSGMKAAVNGVPSLSVLDGWWVEGCIEGVTGWAVGTDGHALHDLPHEPADRSRDAALLYDKLEKSVLPLFYYDRGRFIDVMAHCIGLNGSFFNTHRMMQQYVLNAYYR